LTTAGGRSKVLVHMGSLNRRFGFSFYFAEVCPATGT
jgi:hypothetical protein